MPEPLSPYAAPDPRDEVLSPLLEQAPVRIMMIGFLDLAAGLVIVIGILALAMFASDFLRSDREAANMKACLFGVSVPAILLLLAGRGLLKRKRAGLRWANLAAVSSFVVSGVFAAWFAGRMNGFPAAERNGMIAAGMTLPAFFCGHAFLSLWLLNRKRVRAWLE